MSELIVNTISGLSDLSVGNTTVNTAITSTGITQNGDNISPVQSFRNKIINGNFDFWQRGTTGTSGYVADRWFNNVVGSTAAISRQSFTLGQTDVPNEPSYFHRVVVTSVAGASNYGILTQPIESVRTFAGQTATLSFWAKADASKNIVVEFVQSFGTGGSPSSTVDAIGVTTCALTTSWQKFTITANIPSISGKTLGTNNNDYLASSFWFDAGSDFNARINSLGQQSGTFDIAQVQLEAGSVATPFEMRPLGTELALCQRYYQGNKSDNTTGDYGNSIFRGQSSSTGNFYYWMPFSTIMRAIPTMNIGSPTYSNAGSAVFFNATRHGAEIYISVSLAGGYAVIPWRASAEL